MKEFTDIKSRFNGSVEVEGNTNLRQFVFLKELEL